MARRFTFRLETLLRVRQRALDECQRVVAARLAKIVAERDSIESWRDQILRQAEQARGVRSQTTLDVTAARTHRAHVTFLQESTTDAQRRIAEHEEHLAGERAQLAEVSVALKAIERLKQRRYARHLERETRTETLEQDELATQMYLREQAQQSIRERIGGCPVAAAREF